MTEKIDNSLILGLTGIDPEAFRKMRRRKLSPPLHAHATGVRNRIAYDKDELLTWMDIHLPRKAEIIREYLKHKTGAL